MISSWVNALLEKLPGSWQLQPGRALAFGHTPLADLPECNDKRENEHRFIRGSAGVADQEVVCFKDATDTYLWQNRADVGHDHDSEYVQLSGDTMTGQLIIDEASGDWAGLALVGNDEGGSVDFANTGGYQGSIYTDSFGRIAISNTHMDAISIDGTTSVTTFGADAIVPDEAYGIGWDNSTEVPTKGALYDKIEGVAAGAGITAEGARDTIAAALVAGNNIDITIDDALDTITIAVETLTPADIGADANLATFVLPASTTITTYGASLVNDVNAAAAIATLGLDADLATLSLPASTTITAFSASLLDDTTEAAARDTLGLIAGDAGDIWVEKAGDTMTGALIVNHSLTVNDTAADRDVRIEGTTDPNLLFTDASTNRVGIKTNTPAAELHVVGGARITALGGSGSRILSADSDGDLQDTAVLDNLQDVVLTAPAAGEILTYSGTQWVNNEPSQGIITLDDRTHVYDSTFGTTGTGNTNFDTPDQIAIDSTGRILVADSGNNRLKIHDSAGTYVTSLTSLVGHRGVAVDPNDDSIYITTTTAGITTLSKYSSALALQWSAGLGSLGRYISTDGTHVYVSMQATGAFPTLSYIRKHLCSSGALVSSWGSVGSGNGQFNTNQQIALGGEYIYVADQGNDRIQIFTKAGVFVTRWGSTGSDPGEFQSPYGVAWNPVTEHLLVTDNLRNDVQEFTFEGGYVGYFPTTDDPAGATAVLNDPSGIAVTTDGGSVWVADSTDDKLRKYNESSTTESAISIAMNPEDFIVANDPTIAGQAYISLITPAKSIGALDDVVVDGEEAGEVLTFDGANWVNGNVSGMTLIDHDFGISVTSGAPYHMDGVFTSTYENYLVMISGGSLSGAGTLTMRLRAAGTDSSSGVYYLSGWGHSAGTTGVRSSVAATSWQMLSNGGVQFNYFLMKMTLSQPALAARTSAEWVTTSAMTTPAILGEQYAGFHNASTAYDGFSLLVSASTFVANVRVYGYKET